MSEQSILEDLAASGALRKGHFRLSSGRHSDTYVQCSQLLKDPSRAIAAGRMLAECVSREVGEVDAVLSPALGALLIGFTTALALDRDMLFAERVGGRMSLRRGFALEPGMRVLLVEDVITTGGSILELARLVEEAGARAAALGCIVDRGGLAEPGYPLVSLAAVKADSFEPDECPLCARGVPIDSPGSRYTS
ncbi:MAG: orotate phosphoribosyltransferase [Actinobacteria bacterium]|nr:orotate phosphoribosyltransferase [Actinomycetota bacterium]MBU1942210.1 orotate phosphoribosyltransferase [Actinomycetota bacterium]MBU2687441.1 orotate phosphoribosyltransferase [Actinomycetota bacterium]